MAIQHITLNAGRSPQDFVTVHVEVPDTCQHAAKAVQAGLGEASMLASAIMSSMITRPESGCCNNPDNNSVVQAATTKSIDDTTCTVRVRGRIEGADPICLSRKFDALVSMASQTTVMAATRTESGFIQDLLNDGMPPEMVDLVKSFAAADGLDLDGFSASMGPLRRPESFAGAGAGGLNSFGGFGSNS